MRSRHRGLAIAAAAVALVGFAAVTACVGDDPSSPGGGTDDGGPGSDSSSTPQDGPGGGGDTSVGDGGSDACATADLASDPRNCGACGRDCVHGACNASVCQPWVVSSFDGGTPLGPGVDGPNVYYAIGGNVWRVQVDGGAPVQMTNGLDAKAFAKSATGMLACGTLGANSGVYSLPAIPGAASTLVHAVAACNALTVDGATVWAGRTGSIDEITAATVTHALVPFNERLTGGLAVSADRLYWANQNGGLWNVAKATADTGHAVLNADPINEANGVAVSDKFAYVTARPAGAGGILLRVALVGGATSVVLTSLPQSAFQQGIARAPNGALYFAAGNNLYGYVPPP